MKNMKDIKLSRARIYVATVLSLQLMVRSDTLDGNNRQEKTCSTKSTGTLSLVQRKGATLTQTSHYEHDVQEDLAPGAHEHDVTTTPVPHDNEDELVKTMTEDQGKHQPNPPEEALTSIPAPHDGEDELIQAMMEEDPQQKVSDTGSQKEEKDLVSIVPGNHTMGASLAFQSSNASEWHWGELPSTKELTGNCALNVELTIFSPYWKSHNGKGYMSGGSNAPWLDVGEKWKLKLSKTQGKLVIWNDYWNSHNGKGYKGGGNMAHSDNIGEQWQVFEGKRGDGKVSFWCKYWYDHSRKGWLGNGGNAHRQDIGEEWIVKTKNGKDACPSKGLISDMVFKWRYKRAWNKGEKICKSVGIETELTTEQTRSFSKSVTNVLESTVEVSAEIEGLGGASTSLTSRKEVSKQWSTAYRQAFSERVKRDIQHCLEVPGENTVQWEWVAEADFSVLTGKTIFNTGETIFTASRNSPPKCLPGYMMTEDYQLCELNGYLPGFSGNQCKDNHSGCPGWPWACKDTRYEAWMRQNCPKTCGLCR